MKLQLYKVSVILTGCSTLAATAIVEARSQTVARRLTGKYYGGHLVKISRCVEVLEAEQ